ncbi:MAG: VWA domain-containing protein [Pseudomonadota bacterium]
MKLTIKATIIQLMLLYFLGIGAVNVYAQDANNQTQSNVTQNKRLIDSLKELREKIWFKVDCDIENTSAGFADAMNIQKSLWWSDIFGTALNIVTGTISTIGALLSLKDLSQGLSEELLRYKMPLEIFSGFLTVESLIQSGENLQLAIDGPAYSTNIQEMLRNAYQQSSTRLFFNNDAYKTTIKGYILGSFGDSPVVVHHKGNDISRKNSEIVKGADKVKYAISHKFRDLGKRLSGATLPPGVEDQLIAKIEEIKRSVFHSALRNSEIKYQTYLKDDNNNFISVEQEVVLGSVAELSKRRADALGNFDKRLEREQIMVITSVAGSMGNLIKITFKSPLGRAVGEVTKVFIIPKAINLSDEIMRTSVYKTNPREEINMIPQEMLLNLSKELSDLWMVADDIANYIEQYIPKIDVQPLSNNMATALVLDRSGSMTGEKLEKAKEAAKAFAHTLNPADQVSVSLFSDNASTVVEMSTVSSVLGNIDANISSVTPGNSTNIGSGLEQALMQLEKVSTEQGKRVALLMSDGLNNRGDWHPAVNRFVSKKWRVYTIGFGKDADEAALRKIAELTGGTYWPAGMVDLVNVYQLIGAHAQNKSVILSANEYLAPNGKLTYHLPVTQGAQNLNVFTNWQGSKLLTVLVSPAGETVSGEQLLKNGGRYSEGRTFQMFEVAKPQAGEWKLAVSWAEPPSAPEQINVAVSEKSDVFANLLGFRSEYKIGEPVTINVQAAEVVGDQNKIPLRNASVKVQVQKPGPQMIQMVQAQSSNWTMYKEVMLDVTRSLTLSDDGAQDYNAGDGIFGNSFTETDKNGAYLITAVVKGEKQNGEKVEKKLQGSFQVGPISQNPVTTSQVLQYMDAAKPHINNQTPSSPEVLDQPKKTIEQMQGDPLDNINKVLKKK